VILAHALKLGRGPWRSNQPDVCFVRSEESEATKSLNSAFPWLSSWDQKNGRAGVVAQGDVRILPPPPPPPPPPKECLASCCFGSGLADAVGTRRLALPIVCRTLVPERKTSRGDAAAQQHLKENADVATPRGSRSLFLLRRGEGEWNAATSA